MAIYPNFSGFFLRKREFKTAKYYDPQVSIPLKYDNEAATRRPGILRSHI